MKRFSVPTIAAMLLVAGTSFAVAQTTAPLNGQKGTTSGAAGVTVGGNNGQGGVNSEANKVDATSSVSGVRSPSDGSLNGQKGTTGGAGVSVGGNNGMGGTNAPIK